MGSIGLLFLFVLNLFSFLLIVRIITEMIESFSRQFRPPRWFAVVVEPVFMITDPPVKVLRKLIPPLHAGGVAIDLSVIVLFVLLGLLQRLVITLL